MPSKRRKRKRKAARRKMMGLDKTDFFLMRTTYGYCYRHLIAFPHLELDEDWSEVFLTGSMVDIEDLIRRCLSSFEGQRLREYQGLIKNCLDDDFSCSEVLSTILLRAPKPLEKALRQAILDFLEDRIEALAYSGQSELEKNLAGIRKMFNLTDEEMDFAVFLYLCHVERKLERYFIDELDCHRLGKRKYLSNLLGMTQKQLNKVLTGTLKKIEFFEMDYDDLEINDEFVFLFEDPMTGNITDKFFTRVPEAAIPLEFHHGVQDDLDHVLGLLKRKTQTPTHILLYGPPGTGKSSFAGGLAKALGTDSYLIAKDDDNRSKNRRASLFACMNMTNGGDGSLIVVDEADNILNTRLSFFFRGETQDKGWLNYLLEQPGSRMIWITNEIDSIENSVLRRFAYSLHFKPFSTRQRVLLWGNILEINKAIKYFSSDDIDSFAKKYKTSAGVIDLAVKKAMETRSRSKKKIQTAIIKGLEAHQTLINGGQKPLDKAQVENNFSLEGLNIKADINTVMDRLREFDAYLRNNSNGKPLNFNCLFYGPPGVGKSELAKYIADNLDRELITKRVSDIQSKWLGESEKNIRDAFEEAEREEALLVFDEADSLLFSRDRAVRSYETNMTNEFLTHMENFKGVMICTTNRFKDLDSASIRRFQEKLGFDYLTADGNLVFYNKFFKDLVARDLTPDDQARIMAISNLAPGDFKVVRDRYGFSKNKNLSHIMLIQALVDEAQVKQQFLDGKPIGF